MSETRIGLNRTAIKALALIILTALGGIILLSAWGLTLRYGVFGDTTPDGNSVADEALSGLSNIASAAVGGLVGWLTRDYIETAKATTGYQELPPAYEPPPAPEFPAGEGVTPDANSEQTPLPEDEVDAQEGWTPTLPDDSEGAYEPTIEPGPEDR